jgi:predicted metalloprotease with PDZ domain
MRTFALLFAAAFFLAAGPAHANDGQGNHYRVRIDAEARLAHVEADAWFPGRSLAMFGVQSSKAMPDGQAQFVRDLQATDAAGAPLSIKPLGEGDYELSGQGRVHLRYDVALEHDKHAWPAGLEEVSFFTGDGLVITGFSLLLAPGDGMEGPVDIAFALPAGWVARTPWEPAGANAFTVPTRRELLNNALYFGTAPAQTLDVGGVAVTFVLGARHRAQAPLFAALLERQMAAYRDAFGGDPLARRYLVLVHEGRDDGGAFASSFSQFISGDADTENRLGWGFVMAHELLHFWNGLSLVPADSREEWFKEGITDYLTMVALSRNGLLDRAQLDWQLENVARRYLIARIGQNLGMTVREAGEDKQPNRELVYGGGALAGFALDVQLRKDSDGDVGLPDLLRALYAEFAKPGATYTLADVERHAQALTGHDYRAFFAQQVESHDFVDARPTFADVGLKLDTWLYDEAFVRADPAAPAAAVARHRAIFGQSP